VSAEAACEYIEQLDLSKFDGFRLLILTRHQCLRFDWDTVSSRITAIEHPHELFASSSSRQSIAIPQQRENRYRHWREQQLSHNASYDVGVIPEIHLREPGISPNESIFMVRQHTHTKSISQLVVKDDEVSLRYWPAAQGWDADRSEGWQSPLQVINRPAVVATKAG